MLLGHRAGPLIAYHCAMSQVARLLDLSQMDSLFTGQVKETLTRGLRKEEFWGMLESKSQQFCFAFPELRSALGPPNTI